MKTKLTEEDKKKRHRDQQYRWRQANPEFTYYVEFERDCEIVLKAFMNGNLSPRLPIPFGTTFWKKLTTRLRNDWRDYECRVRRGWVRSFFDNEIQILTEAKKMESDWAYEEYLRKARIWGNRSRSARKFLRITSTAAMLQGLK